MKIIYLLVIISFCVAEETPRVIVRDSYLEAFKLSHAKNVKTVHKASDRDSKVEEKIQNSYGPPSYEPAHQYGHPVPGYPPAAAYGPPAPVYGPPAPVYGPPMHIPR